MTRRHPSRGRTARGFTIVELMVAVVLGLFLLVGLISLLVSTVSSRNELDKTTRQIDNGRYALQVLTESIQLAGFVSASTNTVFANVPPVGCPSSLTELGYESQTSPGTSKVPYPVYLLDATPACIDHVVSGTAMLVVTRASTALTTLASAASDESYLQISTCSTDTVPFVAAAGKSADFNLMQKECSNSKLAPLRKIVQQVYFVSSCNECGLDTTPTLKMAELQGGEMKISALVEGIENFQVDFGVDMDGNGSPDCYTSNPGNPPSAQVAASICPQTTPAYDWTNATTNWTNVMTARVHVLARQTEASAGWVDTKHYNLGLGSAGVGPLNDHYKRGVYSSVARLYNASGQRELP